MDLTAPPTTALAAPTLKREWRAVVRLAVPVVVVQLGLMLMGTVDTMMLGRRSDLALAAGALGNALSFGLIILPMGILMGLDPLVAQAYGAGDRQRVGQRLAEGVGLAVLLSVPLSALMWWLGGELDLLGQKPEVQSLSAGYLRALVPGNVAFLLFLVVRQTLQAMSLVWPAVVAIVVSNILNLGANYVLIFGHYGFPELGVFGSGIATSFSRWVLLLTLLLASRQVLRQYWLAAAASLGRGIRQWLASFMKLLRVGLPVGVQLGLELWVFMTVALLMGNLGAVELAGHQIAINLASLSFMVPLGIGAAASTRVGNAVGRLDSSAARRAAAVCLLSGATVMTLFAVLFWTLPSVLARLYTGDESVLAVAATLIPIAAVFQVADGTQVVGAGILRGVADTRVPAIIAAIGFWGVALPLGWYLAFEAALGPRGLWWGLTMGLVTVAGLLLLRITFRLRGVIEPVQQ